MAGKPGRSGRPRKYRDGGIPFTVTFPTEVRYAINTLADRIELNPGDVVRQAVTDYIRKMGADLLTPDNPEEWDIYAWRAHARKHEEFLGFPYDARCKKCQFGYKDVQDFMKRYMGIGSSKPAPRDYIDKELSEAKPAKVFSTLHLPDWTDADRAILAEHIANSDHKNKRGVLDAREWGYERENHPACPICAELAQTTGELNPI